MGVMGAVVGEAMPCVLMVTMEACTVGLTIMGSTVISRGMSPFVFVFYTNALSSILLLPYCFLYPKDRREQQIFSLPLLSRFFFLGLTGITIAQNLAFVGLSHSSPVLVCAMGNLIPTFSFLLPLILRTTKFDWRDSSNLLKLIGTFISTIGAISITLYKGPVIRKQYSSSLPLLQLVFSSTHEHWILGAIFLAAASLAFSVWNIIQAGTVEKYPEVMKIAPVSTIVGTIQTAVVAMVMERNQSAWRVKLGMELLVIVLTATFGSLIRSSIQIWCTKEKGPFYVPLFKPLGIPIATFFGYFFFPASFHYGSIFGAAIVGMGYYTVMWGEIRFKDSSDDDKVPLLQGDSRV